MHARRSHAPVQIDEGPTGKQGGVLGSPDIQAADRTR